MEAELHKKILKLSKATIYSLIVFTIAYFIRIAFNAILARWLEPHVYGDYSIIMSTVFFLASAALLGLDSSVIEFIPQYIEKNDWGSIAGFLRQNFLVTMVMVAIVFFVEGIILAITLVMHYTGYMHIFGHHPVVFHLRKVSLQLCLHLLCRCPMHGK